MNAAPPRPLLHAAVAEAPASSSRLPCTALTLSLDCRLPWLAAPDGTDRDRKRRRGRAPVFSDLAITLCLTLQAHFALPLRQTPALVAQVLAAAGLTWPVPDYSTLCRRRMALSVSGQPRPPRPSPPHLHATPHGLYWHLPPAGTSEHTIHLDLTHLPASSLEQVGIRLASPGRRPAA